MIFAKTICQWTCQYSRTAGCVILSFHSLYDYIKVCCKFMTFVNLVSVCPKHSRIFLLELLHRTVALTCPRADRWILHPELLPPCRRIKCWGFAALYCRPSPPAMLPSVSTTFGHIPSHIGSSLWKTHFLSLKLEPFLICRRIDCFLELHYWRSSLIVSMTCTPSEHHCVMIP